MIIIICFLLHQGILMPVFILCEYDCSTNAAINTFKSVSAEYNSVCISRNRRSMVCVEFHLVETSRIGISLIIFDIFCFR